MPSSSAGIESLRTFVRAAAKSSAFSAVVALDIMSVKLTNCNKK